MCVGAIWIYSKMGESCKSLEITGNCDREFRVF